MPNTLAHIGIQALATRGLFKRAEAEWIFLGCIIPDVPWILHRTLHWVSLGLDPYDLRLYAIAQSSLAVSLLLCAALAIVSVSPRRIFGVLAFGSLLHLLLDATQTKLGNGVHLFAPLSWELLNFGLYWPESAPTYLLTALGLAVLAYFSDGSVRDVTPLAVYSSSNENVAQVDAGGKVQGIGRGEVAVLIRYLEKITNARVMFLEDVAGFVWNNPPENNYIDTLAFQKLGW